jgi:S-adenosylmethionine synthetase
MTNSFMQSPQLHFTSESVSEGHPDKMCDQISDAVLDAMLSQDPRSRVACEVSATTGLIVVMGEVTTQARLEVQDVVRQTVADIGYTDAAFGFDARTCGVIVSLKGQSPDIAMGVDRAAEAKSGEMTDSEIEAVGAGDQGMMIGFACNETPELMPLPIALAHRLVKRLSHARRRGEIEWLRPDAKSQVTVEYSHGKPKRVDTVLLSTQHDERVTHKQIRDEVIARVIREVIPTDWLDGRTKHYVNPTGRFVIGGPMGDAGLTGRKIIVDTYGGMARHGGGAFSGKDPTKVDRSAAYYARYAAKNLVAAGVADRLEIQVSYAIGMARPLSIMVETFGTGRMPEEKILDILRAHFDFRPGAIIQNLNLRRPIYRPTAAYGHFGRDDIDAPWEVTDKVDAIRAEVGLEPALVAA